MLRVFNLFVSIIFFYFPTGCSNNTTAQPDPIVENYTIGGIIKGLTSNTTLTLSNVGMTNLSIKGNDSSTLSFIFSPSVSNTSTYTVIIKTQPLNQKCVVLSGSGIVDKKNVTDIIVNCASTDVVTSDPKPNPTPEPTPEPTPDPTLDPLPVTHDVAPTLVAMSPTSAMVNVIPLNIIVTFNDPVAALDIDNFVLDGTCTTLPQKSSVTMNPDKKMATLTLVDGNCSLNQILTVSINPSKISAPDGTKGTGAIATNTYTINNLGPSAELGIPSAINLNASGSSVLTLTYTTSASGGTTLSGTLTESGAGVTITSLTGDPSCSVAVHSISTAGATITLSSCNGDGTFTVHVNAGTTSDNLNNTSTVSAESTVITVDNTAPSLSVLNPSTSFVNSTPTSITASFSEDMTALSIDDFTLSGTCTSLPTKEHVVMSASIRSDNTLATLTLSGGTCANGQTLTVSINPTTLSDYIGNAGSGSPITRTYTIDTTGPSAATATPSTNMLNSSTSATLELTYTASAAGETTLSGTLTESGGGVTLTTLTGNPSCSVAVSSMSSAGATITLSSCSGDGTFTVHVDAGTATDSLSNTSTVSPESSIITVDNTAPTLASSSPANATTTTTIPSSFILTFSEVVTVDSDNFSTSSSTCSTPPTISSVSGSGSTSVTVNLSGGSCTNNQTILLTIIMSDIVDLIGNPGSGSNLVTLTYSVPRKIFITTTHNGNLGGISGADSICSTDANKPSDGGTYKALIVDGSIRVACTSANCITSGISEQTSWVLSPSTNYYAVNGTTLIGTTTSAGIFSFPLSAALTSVGSTYAWTGLNTDWTTLGGDTSCSSWATSSSSNHGQTGHLTNDTSSQAISYFAPNCGTSRSFLCVEQN